MTINAQTIAHTASLAKLEIGYGLTDAEAQAALEKITGELSRTIGYIDVLKDAKTDGVEPIFSVSEEAPGTRDDVPQASDSEKILAQAPDRIGNFFAVPKIL